MTSQHIAVLDDEEDITELLATYLRGQGFRVTEVHKGGALMALMADDAPDLVLLDLGLPGEDGFAIARRLREHWQCGLVIVTGRGDAVDKVVGLEIGADDYVTKPFDLRELLARIKAVLRRTHRAEPPVPKAPGGQPAESGTAGTATTAPQPAAHIDMNHAVAVATSAAGSLPPLSALSSLSPAAADFAPPLAPAAPQAAPFAALRDRCRFAGWLLDRGARRLHSPTGTEVALTHGEFELLSVFTTHPERVLSRDFLLENTRGREAGPFDRTVDVQIGRLRKKIEPDPQDPRILKSVRGAGYILVAPVTLE